MAAYFYALGDKVICSKEPYVRAGRELNSDRFYYLAFEDDADAHVVYPH